MIQRTISTEAATGKLQDVKLGIEEARSLLPDHPEFFDLRVEYLALAAKTAGLIRRTDATEKYVKGNQ